jgi:hypothetical protein
MRYFGNTLLTTKHAQRFLILSYVLSVVLFGLSILSSQIYYFGPKLNFVINVTCALITGIQSLVVYLYWKVGKPSTNHS